MNEHKLKKIEVMKKIETLGIGTIIINANIVKSYVKTITDILTAGGVTMEDTKNICETLIFLNKCYTVEDELKFHLAQVSDLVYDCWTCNEVVDMDNDDVVFELLAIMNA